MSADSWYYAVGQTRHGPIPGDELRARLSQGQLGPDHLVWREGMASWTRAGDLPELAPPPPHPLPHAPGPAPAPPPYAAPQRHAAPHRAYRMGGSPPAGVVTAAVGNFLLTAVLLLSAVFIFAFQEQVRRMQPVEPQLEGPVFLLAGVLLLGAAALATATGVGLLRRAGWARVMHWVLFAPSLLCCGNIASWVIPVLCLVGGILISTGSGAAWFDGAHPGRSRARGHRDAF
jgi:hypothetical protein